ncbi:S66 family peptidase [Bacillus tuaregi]|uniref:S66 family peptidase n=1 Tax=Bacillus tuaregi TaxID=1816695 RepID=UPI0008F95B1C|nr:S66 peptidase family protein [Bacillus tuaregi]
MFAERLKPGDEIRIIAPSASIALLKEKQMELAESRLKQLGFHVTFGQHVYKHDEFYSTSIEERVHDLHDAFQDKKVKAILSGLGGYNANQLLPHLDYDLISRNPKILCGYGDMSILSLAIYQKTGLVTYVGPDLSVLGYRHGVEYTIDMFVSALTNDAPYEIYPSTHWSEDHWYKEKEQVNFHNQDEYLVLQPGKAEGRMIAGNLTSLTMLQGTGYMPSLKESILMIEDDRESYPQTFDRALQSLLQQPGANDIKAVLIGRFQTESSMTEASLRKIIKSKAELSQIPIIANVNFGHVHPMATIPIGAKASIAPGEDGVEMIIEQKEEFK